MLRLVLILIPLTLYVAVAELKTLVSHSSLLNDNTHLGIYHGQNTTIEKHPYLVGIIINGKFSCAGTILSESWIITTADCVHWYSTTNLTVVAGSSDGTIGETYKVKRVVIHPNYGLNRFDYEYACIQIDGNFQWSSTTKAIKISTQEPKINSSMTVAGYGSSQNIDMTNESFEDGVGTGTLMEGTMNWISRTVCEEFYIDVGLTWSSRMGCAYNQGNTTLCAGDFGNAFVRKNVMYGMFVNGAYPNFCTKDALPLILADLSPVAKWIKKITGAKFEDEPDKLTFTL